MMPLLWGTAHHLKSLAETEENPEYLRRALKITEILFPVGERDEAVNKIIRSLKKQIAG